ncbi:MAG: TPM domain-containing protein [Planctomycetota bacterium]
MRRIGPIPLLLTALLLALVLPADAGRLTLDRPGDREFIRDTAGLLPPGLVRQLHQRCDTLLDDTNVPIFVVTVESMAAFGGADLTIESFARTLFDDWGDTHPLVHGQDWTNGILLVIAVQDRAARIELGRSWAGSKDTACRRIMDEHLLPAFRAGDYAAGISAGVRALDKMARGEAVPVLPTPLDAYLLWSLVAGLAVFTGVSLIRSGASGWAWVFWGLVLGTIGTTIYRFAMDAEPYDHDAEQRRLRSFDSTGLPDQTSALNHGHLGGFIGGTRGGGRGGGSFGGGGGASGSW